MRAALAFRVVVPGVATYTGLFVDQRAAAADAEQRYPGAPAAWTFCLGR